MKEPKDVDRRSISEMLTVVNTALQDTCDILGVDRNTVSNFNLTVVVGNSTLCLSAAGTDGADVHLTIKGIRDAKGV